ncbi:MAG: hypothetical protein JWM98_1774 [Thermoleophilia bacterium]|nr:hypothetical protein [Thermoleophilia bacterium]
MTDDPSTSPAPATVTWSEPYGRSWTPSGEGSMERHAHALRVGDDVWVIDPIDAPNLDELLAELGGTVRHVVVLLDRHLRDAAAVAERHGAALHVVAGNIRQELPAGAQRFDTELAGSPFAVVPVRDQGKVWCERALWWPEHDLLVVAESLGSAGGFTAGTDAALAVHPVLRLTPPRAAFARATPRTILLGHGRPVTDEATAAVTTALAESRRGAPKFVAETASAAISGVLGRRTDD